LAEDSFRQMDLLIKMNLNEAPMDDVDAYFDQYASALWVEQRKQDSMACAIAKAFTGGDNGKHI